MANESVQSAGQTDASQFRDFQTNPNFSIINQSMDAGNNYSIEENQIQQPHDVEAMFSPDTSKTPQMLNVDDDYRDQMQAAVLQDQANSPMVSSGRQFYQQASPRMAPHYGDLGQHQDRSSQGYSMVQNTNSMNPNRPIMIEPRSSGRSHSVLRSTIAAASSPVGANMMIRTKQHAYKRTSVFQQRNNSYLSSNMWENNRRKTIDHTNLSEIASLNPEFKSIRRIEDYSGLMLRSNEHMSPFKMKVMQQLPKGRQNFAEQISFLERIITKQDKIHDLHHAYTRQRTHFL